MDDFSLLYNVGLGAETDHDVILVFHLKESRCTFIVFSVFGTAGTGKPFGIDIVSATSGQCSLVFFFHFMFDDGGEVGSGEGHVGGIRVHFTVLEVGSVDVYVYVIIVKLEHA